MAAVTRRNWNRGRIPAFPVQIGLRSHELLMLRSSVNHNQATNQIDAAGDATVRISETRLDSFCLHGGKMMVITCDSSDIRAADQLFLCRLLESDAAAARRHVGTSRCLELVLMKYEAGEDVGLQWHQQNGHCVKTCDLCSRISEDGVTWSSFLLSDNRRTDTPTCTTPGALPPTGGIWYYTRKHPVHSAITSPHGGAAGNTKCREHPHGGATGNTQCRERYRKTESLSHRKVFK